MDASWLAVAVLAGAGVGAAAAWRARSSTVERADRALGAAELDIERSLAAADEARRVQDLTLASMQEGVLLVDGHGRTVFANDALTRHLGAKLEALSHLYPPSVQEMAGAVALTRIPGSIETETGSPARWLRFTATPAGTDGSVLLVVTDVSETRRAEAVRKDFVANASHELKTPAASIQAAAETLRDAASDDPEAVPRFAAQLERDAMRLSRIVADLLDLSRLESETALDERVALDALVREEGQRCENAAREAGLELHVETPRPATVVGSARDLSLLIRNLIDNAIRYTGPSGRIFVRVAPERDEVVLTVEDTGVGIPSRELPRVFERFYRVDRARSRETGGTGLGLAIVKHVAENHGGRVQVQSELGRGSTFEVHLPAAYPAVP